jgi:hypothetical protein
MEDGEKKMPYVFRTFNGDASTFRIIGREFFEHFDRPTTALLFLFCFGIPHGVFVFTVR